MKRALAVSYIVALFTTGVVAGVFFSEQLGLSPVLKELPAGDYLRFKQAIIRAYNPVMPILGIGGSIFFIAWLVLAWRDGRASPRWRLGLASFFLLAASTATTMIGELPANSRLLELSPDRPDAAWTALREQTLLTIEIRTAIAMVSFFVLCLAAAASASRASDERR